MSETIITGGCLCGAVRFELTEAPNAAIYCHCTRCQRRTGTAASASAAVDGRAFRIVAGAELIKGWLPPDGGYEKCFCGACGAHLFSRHPQDHNRLGIRMGAFDADPGIRPTVRQFVAYAAPWEPIPDDGLTRYGESRPQ